MEKNSKIFVSGHRGMVGSSIVRKLEEEGYENIIVRSHEDLDLKNQEATERFFKDKNPEYVFLAAAKVGGISANSKYRAQFIYDNLMIQSNVINCSHVYGVKKLLFLGSSCIYPKLSKQPIKEEYLLSGQLEPTNESYAIAKIAGVKMCESYRDQYGCNFISVMPTNLYGENDSYDLENSHVLPAILRKMIVAKREEKIYVEIWGTGNPRREFMHVNDLADACYFLMKNYDEKDPINVGVGYDISIRELSELIREIVGYEGKLSFDEGMPDGTMKKLLDITKIKSLGWEAKIGLYQGIEKVYREIKSSPFL